MERSDVRPIDHVSAGEGLVCAKSLHEIGLAMEEPTTATIEETVTAEEPTTVPMEDPTSSI